MSLSLNLDTTGQPPEDVAELVVTLLRERFGDDAPEVARDQLDSCEDDSREIWERINALLSSDEGRPA